MRATRVFGVVVAAVLLSACGSDDTVSSNGGSSSGDGGPGASVYDGEYLATEVSEDGQPKALVEGTHIRLRLGDGSLSASAGCNSLGGDATIEDDVLRVGDLFTTKMGCDKARHAQDEWLAEVLSSSPTLAATDTGFLLQTSSTEITFVDRRIAEPDLELVGTTWIVDGYLDGTGPDAAVSSGPDTGAKVVFEDDGFVTGNDGCNDFGYGGPPGAAPTDGLRYEVDGDRITLSGSAASTLIGCPDVDTARFWAVLSGTVTWAIDADRLTLVNEDDQGLTLRAES